MRRAPLPSDLRGVAIRTSGGEDFGLRRSRLRRMDVEHPFHGVGAVDIDLSTTPGLCRAYEPLLLPGQFFSHVTAALLYGAPLPFGIDAEALDVAVLDPRTPPRGRGVRAHRVTGVEMLIRDGLPVASPADVWCQLAPILRREDLVAVGDHLLTGRRVRGIRAPALATLAHLRGAAFRHRGKRGARNVSWSLERVRSGVDSRPETQLRLLLVAAGLPEPELDIEVDVGDGVLLHPDLAYSRWRVLFEYEGDVHRTDQAVWRRDIERRELYEAVGWRAIRVTADNLFNEPEIFLARVRRIFSSR